MTSGFHEVSFPLPLALATSGGPRRRTEIVNLSNGRESRNSRWRRSRRSYDAGSGLRSLADLYTLLAFFEARGGQLNGFRFRDPTDFRSRSPLSLPQPQDQLIATGDGKALIFPLIKTYGDAGGQVVRRITKPIAGTVSVAIGGQPLNAQDFTVDTTTGIVTITQAKLPAAGVPVTAGFEFEVPVRFDTDRLDISLHAFQAGRIPAIPLIEIDP